MFFNSLKRRNPENAPPHACLTRQTPKQQLAVHADVTKMTHERSMKALAMINMNLVLTVARKAMTSMQSQKSEEMFVQLMGIPVNFATMNITMTICAEIKANLKQKHSVNCKKTRKVLF